MADSIFTVDPSNTNGRYAITGLDPKYASIAYPEELMLNLETGEIKVKTASKAVVSYDYASRYKYNVDKISTNSINQNLVGSIYEIDINSGLGPKLLTTTDITINETINANYSKIMIIPDIDIIVCDIANLSAKVVSTDDYTLTINFSNGGVTKSITESATKLATTVINLQSLFGVNTPIKPTITNIVINHSFTEFAGVNKRIINLNTILASIK